MSEFPYRIGVDLAAAAGKKSGLGFYVENITRELRELIGDKLVTISTVKKQLRTPQRLLWDQIGLPATALAKKLDLLFVPAFSAPRFPKPIVMTAHDLYGMLYPEDFSGPARRYWQHALPQSMRRAEHLIAISEYTKKSIVQELNIPESRITVIPLAAGPQFKVVRNVEWLTAQLALLGIHSPFILSVGTIEPRKNYPRLIEAFAFANRGDAKLVIVGKTAWGEEAAKTAIRKYRLHDSVVFVDYVTEEQLVALYNCCLFFVMPSLFEGFGLPALEAMQCGAPVAVSQNTSLPEVVSEAGVLFDPYDPTSIRERLNLLFGDEKMRSRMQQLSLERAQQFSWRKTAEYTLAVFRAVLTSRT